MQPFFAGAYLLRVDDRDRSEVPDSRALASRVRKLLGTSRDKRAARSVLGAEVIRARKLPLGVAPIEVTGPMLCQTEIPEVHPVTMLAASSSPHPGPSSTALLAPIGGTQRVIVHPQAVRTALVIHDGTRETEALGQGWATLFGASVTTLEAPACRLPCTGLDSDWVARIKEVGPDLVVLARDTRGGLRGPAGLSEYLLDQLDVPVLACGAESVCPRQLRTILAPIAGTGEGTEVLPLLLTVARTVHAEVVLLHVVEALTTSGDGPLDSDLDLQAFGRALQRLEQLKLAFQMCGVSTRALVRPGPVVAVVASVAKRQHFDLLAISTDARTGAARSIHGSIAAAIARMVPQPILWVHGR